MKKYKNIDKNAILNAAKRVVKLSDEDFRVYSKRNLVEASKVNIINKGFLPKIRVSKITLETYHEDTITKAKLIITRNDNFNEQKANFVSKVEYDFFWRRMDYILGLNTVWESCFSHILKNESVLCDFLYNKNSNANKSNIIEDTRIFVQKEIIEENSNIITQIDLTVLDSITLPFINKKLEVEEPTAQKDTETSIQIEEILQDDPSEVEMPIIKIEELPENNDIPILEIEIE
jgi:hypothetical protein